MSEQESLDLSKVVGLIMENPQLIEQISNLARQKPDTEPSDSPPAAEATEPIPEKESEPVLAQPTYSPAFNQRSNRAQLLGALKPYVSKERAQAIDSMISIADVLDMMRKR